MSRKLNLQNGFLLIGNITILDDDRNIFELIQKKTKVLNATKISLLSGGKLMKKLL